MGRTKLKTKAAITDVVLKPGMNANSSLLKLVQNRVAQTCIGPSTLRNQGCKGVISAARDYLSKEIDLREFGMASSKPKFQSVLQRHTTRLMRSFPRSVRENWGAARKALNIFLMEAQYNRVLCDKYKLNRITPWLEVPLDRSMAQFLHEEYKGITHVPKPFRGVKWLTAKQSEEYQLCAAEIAGVRARARVYLDLESFRRPVTNSVAIP